MKQRHALAALIDDVRTANNWSDTEIAARAAGRGHKLSKSNISRIRNAPVVTVSLEQIAALADGLGVTRSMIANAALASMGIVNYSSSELTAEEAVRRDPTLTERDKKMLLNLIGSLRSDSSNQEGVVEHVRSSSNKQAGESPAQENYDLAAYETGEPKSMKRRQTDLQDEAAEGSQDPDDYKGE